MVEDTAAGDTTAARKFVSGLIDDIDNYDYNKSNKVLEGIESGSTSVDDLLKNLVETTNGKGIARNFESTGGYDQTLKDFEALNLSNVKDIQTKYGPGKV